MTSQKILKAVVYARVSSKEQEKEGYSIPSQLKLLYSYAQKNGIAVAKEFVDIETAKESGRTHFSQMIKFVQGSRDIKTILCEKTDRLYRNFKDYVIVDELDLTLVFVKEGSVLNRQSRSHEKFIHGIKVLMAKNYIDNLSEETRKGMLEKAEEGEYPSFAPLGYVHDKTAKTISIDPDRAGMIREMFEDYASGDVSCRDMAKRMEAKGLKTRRGGRVVWSHINSILKNPFYYGAFFWSGRLWQGKHEPMITKDLFDRVQSVVHRYKNTRAVQHGFAYAGLLVCSKCGSSVTAEIKKGRYVYYHCTFNRGKCGSAYVREEDIEKQFENIFEGFRFSPELKAAVRTGLEESLQDKETYHKEALRDLNEEYEKLQNRISQMYVDKLDGAITECFYKEKIEVWGERQAAILDQIKKHQAANINYVREGIRLIELADNSLAYFKKWEKIEKAILIKTILPGSGLKQGRIAPVFRKPFDLIWTMAQEGRKIPLEALEGKKKAGRKGPAVKSVLLPGLDNFRTFCFRNKIDIVPEFMTR